MPDCLARGRAVGPSGPHPWALAALGRAAADLASSGEGERANRAHRAARAIGGLIDSGGLDRDDVESALVAAAVAAGLPEREACGHVRNGIRSGLKAPRPVPHHDASAFRPVAGPAVPTRNAVPRTRPTYPPAVEVDSLLRQTTATADDPEVADWLRGRGLDPDAIDLERVARALPRDAVLPPWAACGPRSWIASGHRLLVPLVDSTGTVVTVRARSVVADAKPKTLAPGAFEVRGSVAADLVALSVLRGAPVVVWNRVLVVTEGIPDTLTWATNRSDGTESTFGVIGVDSGSWTDDVAARIPDGTEVAIWTHHDPSGDSYARNVADSLRGRCNVRRSPRGVP